METMLYNESAFRTISTSLLYHARNYLLFIHAQNLAESNFGQENTKEMEYKNIARRWIAAKRFTSRSETEDHPTRRPHVYRLLENYATDRNFNLNPLEATTLHPNMVLSTPRRIFTATVCISISIFNIGCVDQSVNTGGKDDIQVQGVVSKAHNGSPASNIDVFLAYRKNNDGTCDGLSDDCEVVENETGSEGKYLFEVPSEQEATLSVEGYEHSRSAGGLADKGHCAANIYTTQKKDLRFEYQIRESDIFLSGEEGQKDIEVYACFPITQERNVTIEKDGSSYDVNAEVEFFFREYTSDADGRIKVSKVYFSLASEESDDKVMNIKQDGGYKYTASINSSFEGQNSSGETYVIKYKVGPFAPIGFEYQE